jgi:hypothetical protein
MKLVLRNAKSNWIQFIRHIYIYIYIYICLESRYQLYITHEQVNVSDYVTQNNMMIEEN